MRARAEPDGVLQFRRQAKRVPPGLPQRPLHGVVDMYDPALKTQAGRGDAEGTIPDQSDKDIKKSMKRSMKMFEKYPPKDKT